MVKDKIDLNDLAKYRKVTEKAYEIVKKNVSKEKEKDALEIIEMVSCYLSDSLYFEEQGDLINSFGAIYYAHGWIDCGARLGIFEVTDSNLFVTKD